MTHENPLLNPNATFGGRKPIEAYEEWLRKREKQEQDTQPTPQEQPPAQPDIVTPANLSDISILTYDDPFFRKLITDSNKEFAGTGSEIPIDANSTGEVPDMHILRRLALITTLYNDAQLQSYEYFPITPLQSEQLLQQGRPPNPRGYWEYLALILYTRTGANLKEANALYQSLQQHKAGLGISDLEQRLLIINAGIEKDASMPYGVKPIILPKITQACAHPVLKIPGQYNFEYGLEQGLPSVSDLGKGSRTLYLSSQSNPGLRVLSQRGGSILDAFGDNLAVSFPDIRVTFCRNGAI